MLSPFRVNVCIRVLLLTAIGAALSACVTADAGRNAGPRTVVEVENRNFADMNVYVLRAGQRIRLGTVSGGGRKTLTIPDYVVEGATELQFMVDPVGSRQTPRSFPRQVTPGDRVRLVIPAF